MIPTPMGQKRSLRAFGRLTGFLAPDGERSDLLAVQDGLALAHDYLLSSSCRLSNESTLFSPSGKIEISSTLR